VGIGMAGEPKIERLVTELGIVKSVRLTSALPREQMRDLFRIAVASVSPSLHDGTPNTLLESMACGALPIAGDIESVREWIVDGENGLLLDPSNVDALSKAMVRATVDVRLRADAAAANREIVISRANEANAEYQTGALYRAAVDAVRS
jgi:glycosyltransferase involved in cell wall biosynthesis